MSARELAELFEQLPSDAKEKLERFAKQLKESRRTSREKSVDDYSFSWAGGLRELRDQFTSVELQHKTSEWRLES